MTGDRSPLAPVALPFRVASLGDVDIGYLDGTGPGEPVLLMHAAWGSAEMWAPQMRPLADAGYRPIAWSRRGHRGSGTGPATDPGSLADDLNALADALGLDRFHLVGTAFGAFGAVDYAVTRQSRLLSLVVASSLCGITDPDFVENTRRLVPPAWEELPIELRELSASYRFRDPQGTARWIELTRRAVEQRVRQRPNNVVRRTDLRHLHLPALFLTGDADPYMPPPRMAALAAEVPGSAYGVIEGAGHSPAWENPDDFNRRLIDHLAQRGAR